jgi:raffinose/stachyose/melibiose transport system permease protein
MKEKPKNRPIEFIQKKSFPTHIIVFLAPAIIIYTVFMIFPLIDSLRLGFYGKDPMNPTQEIFVGTANYERLLTNDLWAPRLVGAIKNNFLFFAVHMLVQNPIGLILAVLLSSQYIRGRVIYRTLIFVPTVLSVVLVGFVWQLILSPLWGIARGILTGIGMADAFQPWLGQQETSLLTLSLISVWQYVGIPMMLFLASLISIPDELIEAARVDGATAWGIFWRIKLPLIMPTVGIVSVLTFVGNFNAFDLIFTVQGALAGPNYSSDILGTFFYRTFFGQQLQIGDANMGAAVAGVMFLIILSGVLLYLFGFQRRVQQYEF